MKYPSFKKFKKYLYINKHLFKYNFYLLTYKKPNQTYLSSLFTNIYFIKYSSKNKNKQ